MIDLFGDVDTREVAVACEVVPVLDRATVAAAWQRLRLRGHARWVVAGGGLEHDPPLLAWLGSQARGIDPLVRASRLIADPARWLRFARQWRLPLPSSRLDSPGTEAGWLVKRAGGCGGAAVRRWQPAAVAAGSAPGIAASGTYFQREVPGRAYSLTFIARAARPARRTRIDVVGFNRLLTDSREDLPWTNAGAISRCAPPAAVARAVIACAVRVSTALRLRGLAGIDFIVDGSRWWLVDVNPRPTATAILYDGPRHPLFDGHASAVSGLTTRGRSPRPPARGPLRRRAQRIVYADGTIEATARGATPGWLQDRPLAGTVIPAGQPVCTVSVAGPEGAAALLARLEERARHARRWVTTRTTTTTIEEK